MCYTYIKINYDSLDVICEFVSGRKKGRKEGIKVSSASQTNKKASHIKLVLQQKKGGCLSCVCVCVCVCVCACVRVCVCV